MNTSNIATASKVANQLIRKNFFLPCVPLSVSSNLVAVSTLAKKLSTVVSASSPKLVKTSYIDFTEIQRKKAELREQVEECSMTDEALLDVCLLNVEDMFSHLAAYLIAQGQVVESNENQNAQNNALISLNLVHDYATAVGLVVTDYYVDGAIQPEMLLGACLQRVEVLQKRWQDNYFRTMELGLQLQRDAVFGAVASCLIEICQDGLENQISLEPMPQTQADVLGALAMSVDFPFSSAWPQLRERGIASNRQGIAGNIDGEGGMQ